MHNAVLVSLLSFFALHAVTDPLLDLSVSKPFSSVKIAQLDIRGFNKPQLDSYLEKITLFKNNDSIYGLLVTITSPYDGRIIDDLSSLVMTHESYDPSYETIEASVLYKAFTSFGKPIVIFVDLDEKCTLFSGVLCDLVRYSNRNSHWKNIVIVYKKEDLEDQTHPVPFALSLTDAQRILLTTIHEKNPHILPFDQPYSWWSLIGWVEVVK